MRGAESVEDPSLEISHDSVLIDKHQARNSHPIVRTWPVYVSAPAPDSTDSAHIRGWKR